MKSVREEALRWVQFLTFAAIWIGLIFLTQREMNITVETIKTIPDAITIYAVLAFFFVKWGWKWRIFRGWLVPFPNLQGTWEGTITSTWKSTAGQAPAPIPATLVIRHKFSEISCVLYTGESESHSMAAQVNEDSAGVLRLSYTYTSRPKPSVRDRSEIHDGAAVLTVGEAPTLSLKGEYWTGRKTTGEMSFQFKSRKVTTSPSSAHDVTVTKPI
jgi:hypothetical protein